jgi:hypothetical protein
MQRANNVTCCRSLLSLLRSAALAERSEFERVPAGGGEVLMTSEELVSAGEQGSRGRAKSAV